MKPLIFILFALIPLLDCSGQTFNKRFVVSELSLGGVISSSDELMKVESVGLSEGTFLTCLLGFDNGGLVLDSICLGYEEPFPFGFFLDAEGVSMNENRWISLGSVIFPEDIAGGWYIVIDENLSVVREKRWISSFYDEKVGSLSALSVRSDALLLNDGKIFVSYDGSTDQLITQIDAAVICFDNSDEPLWESQWMTEANDRANALTYFNDNIYVIISTNIGNLLVDNVISIYKLDPSNGNVVESWNEPWNINVTEGKELLAVQDGMVLVGSAIINNNQYTDAFITKINGNVEELWYQVLDNPNPNFRGYFTEVVQTTDGNYVAAGEWEYSLPEFDPVNGSSNDDGWLVKFDAQTGDIIWDRKYHYIEDVNDEHEIYDLTACADGGVAFTGEALDLTINDDPDYEYPLQQGWIVKVDEHGCVVPGCHTSVEEHQKSTTHFMAGPNPVPLGQELHIYLHEHSTGGEFTLTDNQGKIIKQFTASSSSTTYSLSTVGLASGGYVLTLAEGIEPLQREKVIIE